MEANETPFAPDVSPRASYGLLVVALVVALLGLTTLDVAGGDVLKKRQVKSERTPECIVASAVFAGVRAIP